MDRSRSSTRRKSQSGESQPTRGSADQASEQRQAQIPVVEPTSTGQCSDAVPARPVAGCGACRGWRSPREQWLQHQSADHRESRTGLRHHQERWVKARKPKPRIVSRRCGDGQPAKQPLFSPPTDVPAQAVLTSCESPFAWGPVRKQAHRAARQQTGARPSSKRERRAGHVPPHSALRGPIGTSADPTRPGAGTASVEVWDFAALTRQAASRSRRPARKPSSEPSSLAMRSRFSPSSRLT